MSGLKYLIEWRHELDLDINCEANGTKLNRIKDLQGMVPNSKIVKFAEYGIDTNDPVSSPVG